MFIVVVEFHDKKDQPKVFGPFESRQQAQHWLNQWPDKKSAKRQNMVVPYSTPWLFTRVSIQTLEGWKLLAE